jgi:PAS domain S-box-containing protein
MNIKIPGRATIKLIIVLSGSIVACEMILLELLPRILGTLGWVTGIANAAVLTFVLFPLLYFFSFRPLRDLAAGLRESEERFRSVYENSTIGLYRTTPDGKIILANPTLVRKLGYSTFEELAKRNLEKKGFEPSYQRKQFIEQIEKYGEVYGIESAWTCHDGSVVNVRESARAIRDSKGQTLYYDGTVEDITERKRIEIALQESEERYRSIIHASPDNITIADMDGRIVMVSPLAVSMFGFEREEQAYGFSITDFIVPEDRERALSNISLKMQGTGAKSNEYRGLRRNGSTFDIEVNSDFILGTDGRPKKIVLIARDITQRKQAEVALRESDKKFRTLFESSRDALMTLTPPLWLFTSCNQSTVNMFKAKSVEEFISLGPATVSPERQPDGRLSSEKSIEMVDKAMYVGSHYFEWTHKRITGEEFPATVLLTRMELEGKQFLHATVRDITERKRAEEALRESEVRSRKLAAIVESSDDAIIGKTLDGIVTSWNRGAECVYGYSESEMIGKPISVLLPPGHSDETETILEKIKSGSRLVHYESIRQRKDGQRIDMSLTISPIKNSEGEVIAASTIGRDITERKRTERLLRQSEEKFKTAFLTSPDSININRLEDGMYVSINDGFTRITGYTAEDAIGKTSVELNIWEDIETRNTLVAALMARGSIENLETRFRKKNGGTLVGLMSASLIEFEGVPHILSITRDISEMKLAEEKRMDLERRLLQAQKLESIGTLAGGIAHDFNNVLGGIMGYTEMSLQYTEKDSKLERNLLKVLKATERAKHLIEQILTFSRKTSPQKMITCIRPIIKEAMDLLRASIPTSVAIESDLEKNTKSVLADPTKIHEVVLNLATNAVHAMNRKGTLTINLYNQVVERKMYGQTGEIKPGEYSVIEVADTGCGMDATTLSKAFEPFFTTKAIGEGTGMGLSVVLGVVQSLGGEILVESDVGRGTTFRLYLPAVEEPVSSATSDEALFEISGTERVLFVDDEPMLVEMVKDMLTPLGYTITGVSSSVDALQSIKTQSNNYDIVITDQTMPDMTGMELAKEVLKFKRDLPVILCTGFSSELNPERATALGVQQILMKPFRVDDLGKAIRTIFDNNH